jgi:hypothetical protein
MYVKRFTALQMPPENGQENTATNTDYFQMNLAGNGRRILMGASSYKREIRRDALSASADLRIPRAIEPAGIP